MACLHVLVPSPRTDGLGRRRRCGGSHGPEAGHEAAPDDPLGAARTAFSQGWLPVFGTCPSGRCYASPCEPAEEGILRRLGAGVASMAAWRFARLTGASANEDLEMAKEPSLRQRTFAWAASHLARACQVCLLRHSHRAYRMLYNS